MGTDFSKILYDKYFSSDKRIIEVTLKNGKKIKGIFISFSHGDEDSFEPYISTWHIVNEKDKMTFGINAFGNKIGEIINQKDIESVLFLDDHTKIEFK